MQAKATLAAPTLTHSAAPCPPGTGDGCGIGELFHLLGRVHMLDILYQFLCEPAGPRRFVDLQSTLGISPNTLSERLKALVEAGLLSRTAYNEIPPRVDYEATAKAHDLQPVFEALWAWSQRHALKPSPPASQVATVTVTQPPL
jgi:DNA-binding HxlR family transcriptional regulator